MKLKRFILALEKISESVDNPGATDVRMADHIPVVYPILEDGVVIITDIEPARYKSIKRNSHLGHT